MNGKKIKSKIRIMNEFYDFYKTIPKTNRGIPVIARLYKAGTLIEVSEIMDTTKSSNKKGKKNLSHPEYKLIQFLKDEQIEEAIDMWVSLSPCKWCRDDIGNFIRIGKGNIKSIYFLLENTWNKVDGVDFSSMSNPTYEKIIHSEIIVDKITMELLSESSIHALCEEMIDHQNNMYADRRRRSKSRNKKTLSYDRITMEVKVIE